MTPAAALGVRPSCPPASYFSRNTPVVEGSFTSSRMAIVDGSLGSVWPTLNQNILSILQYPPISSINLSIINLYIDYIFQYRLRLLTSIHSQDCRIGFSRTCSFGSLCRAKDVMLWYLGEGGYVLILERGPLSNKTVLIWSLQTRFTLTWMLIRQFSTRLANNLVFPIDQIMSGLVDILSLCSLIPLAPLQTQCPYTKSIHYF